MTGLHWLVNIIGGAALLIWSAKLVRAGVVDSMGGNLRRLLSGNAGNRATAFGAGLAIAGLLQSSTATALMCVALASGGLLSTMTGLSVMLGADLGSTLVVLALSFDLSWLSPFCIAGGVIVMSTSQKEQTRNIGRALLGLGLILLSLTLIVTASEPLKSSPRLRALLDLLHGLPVMTIAIGALLTWFIHSSVAFILFIVALISAGSLPVSMGFALVLGANIGSGLIPAVLHFRSTADAKRILFGNLAFRIIGVALVATILPTIEPYLLTLPIEDALKVPAFHLAFNILLGLLFLPFVHIAADSATWALPQREEEEDRPKPKFLDPNLVNEPGLALGFAAREIIRMADIVEKMLVEAMNVFESGDFEQISRLKKLDDDVDFLHEQIKLYLTQVSRNALSADDSNRCVNLITFNTNLEHIGDIIDRSLIELARKKIRHQYTFSSNGWCELKDLHSRVVNQMHLAMSVLLNGDAETSRQLIVHKDFFRALEKQAEQAHFERLRDGQVETIETNSLHMDIIRDLKRINAHLTTVAYPVLSNLGELRESRLKKHAKTTPIFSEHLVRGID